MDKFLNGLVLNQVCLKCPYSYYYYFWFYINDLSENLSKNAKLFADDSSLFSVVRNINTSATHLNNDSRKIN